MISDKSRSVIERARQIYERHRRELESQHRDKFVAIEPESAELFVAESFDEAVKAARTKFPSKITHTVRVGHKAAFHIGMMQQ